LVSPLFPLHGPFPFAVLLSFFIFHGLEHPFPLEPAFPSLRPQLFEHPSPSLREIPLYWRLLAFFVAAISSLPFFFFLEPFFCTFLWCFVCFFFSSACFYSSASLNFSPLHLIPLDPSVNLHLVTLGPRPSPKKVLDAGLFYHTLHKPASIGLSSLTFRDFLIRDLSSCCEGAHFYPCPEASSALSFSCTCCFSTLVYSYLRH